MATNTLRENPAGGAGRSQSLGVAHLIISAYYQTRPSPRPVTGPASSAMDEALKLQPTFAQAYTYDPLNRLETAAESGTWAQSYEYDQYGNRCVTLASYIQAAALTPQSLAAFGAVNNRLLNAGYDSAVSDHRRT